MPGTVRLISPEGLAADVPEADVGQWRIRGFVPETPEAGVARVGEATRAAQTSPVEAFGQGVASTATGGASDILQAGLGGDSARLYLSQLERSHPIASTAGQIAGAFVPGAGSLAGAAGRGVSALGAEAGALGKIGYAIAGGATEGAIYGVGQGVHELSLSQEPLTVERAASVLSSNALFGAGTGALAGGAFKATELGLSRAKSAIDGALARQADARAAAAFDPAAIGPETDVSLLDRKGLKIARDQELEAARVAQQPEREAFVDELAASRVVAEDDKTWLATRGGKTRDVRKIGLETLEADRRIDRLLKVERDVVDNPAKALSALRQQEQALTKLRDWGEVETQRYLDEVASAPARIREELLAGKYKDQGFIVGKGAISPSSPVVDDIVERLRLQKYPHAATGELPTNLRVLNAVPEQLERNKALQDRLAKLVAPPATPRLAQIDAAEHALGVKAAADSESPLGHLLSAAAPFAGPLGVAATTGARALGGLRKAAAAVGERAGKAASTFLDVTSKATKKAAPYAPVVATKVLGAVRFADEPKNKEQPTTLPELFRVRSDEVKSQVHIAADGTFQMRPAARQKMAAKLDGIRHIDPVAADRLETAGARRVEWLASQIPRRPDFGTIQIGPDRWIPPDMEMRTWARKVAAVEHPHDVLDRAARGRVTPDEAMALRAVHPEILADYIASITGQLGTLKRTLPYNRRLALSILTGKAVDPSMTAGVLRVIQGMYRSEPGTAGGTQAPIPQPAFGSVKRSDPGTPAQRREGLAAP